MTCVVKLIIKPNIPMAMLSRLFHLNHELDPARLTSVVRQNEGENSLAVYLLNGVRVNCTGSNKKSSLHQHSIPQKT